MKNSNALPSVATPSHSKALTPLEVFTMHQDGNLPSLCAMGSASSQEKVLRRLIATFMQLNTFFNCEKKLTEENARFLSEEILDRFGGWITAEDVKIVIRRIKGKKLYNAITTGDIMEEFEKYDVEHCEVVQRYHQQAKKQSDDAKPTKLPYSVELDENGKQVYKVSETFLDKELYDAWVELGCARRVKDSTRTYFAQIHLQAVAKRYIAKYGTLGRDEEQDGQTIHLTPMQVAIREVCAKYKSSNK